MLPKLGGNTFEAEHTKTRKRQRTGNIPSIVLVNQYALKNALDWYVDGDEFTCINVF